MRQFNTSDPNIIKEDYILLGIDLIEKGLPLIKNDRYFAIWASPETGKSIYAWKLSFLPNHQSLNNTNNGF